MENFNSFSDDIKFTYEFDKERVSFLDLKVIPSNGKLILTSLYSKLTDYHQYLHYKSSHPKHTKRPTIHSQTFRFKKIFSEESDVKEVILKKVLTLTWRKF